MYLSDYSNTQILEHFGFPLNEINQNKIEQWLTREIKEGLDQQLEKDLNASEAIAFLKLFNPYANGHWYISQFNLVTGHLFGFACLGDHQMAELGYCSFRELFEFYMHHPFLHIERDIAYEAVSLATIIHKCKEEYILL